MRKWERKKIEEAAVNIPRDQYRPPPPCGGSPPTGGGRLRQGGAGRSASCASIAEDPVCVSSDEAEFLPPENKH